MMMERNKKEKTLTHGFSFEDGLLYYKVPKRHINAGQIKLFIPHVVSMKVACLHLVHDEVGHFGVSKVMVRVQAHFYFVRMSKFCRKYVAACIPCQENKTVKQKPAGEMMLRDLPPGRWVHIAMDLCVAMPVTSAGNDSFLLFVDIFSGELRGQPCSHKINAIGVSKIYLKEIYCHEGAQEIIYSDRGSVFNSEFMKSLLERLTAIQIFTTAYKHSNGGPERGIQTVLQVLRVLVNYTPEDWDEYFDYCLFLINMEGNASRGGLSPFFINKGYSPKHGFLDVNDSQRSASAIELVEIMKELEAIVKQELIIASEKYKENYDVKRRNEVFVVGQKVWLETKNLSGYRSKLSKKRIGPFLIVDVDRWNNYKLDLPVSMCRLHPWFSVEKLSEYVDSLPGQLVANEFEYVDGELQWEVEFIVDHKFRRQQLLYRIRWKSFGDAEDTWEPIENLTHCAALILDYWTQHSTTAAAVALAHAAKVRKSSKILQKHGVLSGASARSVAGTSTLHNGSSGSNKSASGARRSVRIAPPSQARTTVNWLTSSDIMVGLSVCEIGAVRTFSNSVQSLSFGDVVCPPNLVASVAKEIDTMVCAVDCAAINRDGILVLDSVDDQFVGWNASDCPTHNNNNNNNNNNNYNNSVGSGPFPS